MAAIDPPTADMAEDDPSAPRSTRFDWDKIATEEAAKLEREEREEREKKAQAVLEARRVEGAGDGRRRQAGDEHTCPRLFCLPKAPTRPRPPSLSLSGQTTVPYADPSIFYKTAPTSSCPR